ncbi:MAG: bifunctional oligoribonuclease/PAP phosphatase NrnA [bacterium]
MDFSELSALIRSYNSFGLFCHINPDGDCVGAVLAMYHFLKGLGRSVYAVSCHGAPSFFRFLPGADEVISAEKARQLTVEVAVTLDCGDEKRVGDELIPALRRAARRVNIDHHISNNSDFADLNYVDPHASSTCEIIYRFFEQEKFNITPDIAACLYTGIMFDTGRFKYATTTPEVFRVCSALVAAGADPGAIAVRVYDQRSLPHLHLLGYALSNLRTDEDGALLWSVIEQQQMKEMKVTDEDFDGVVEVLGAYRKSEVYILFSATDNGRVRVNLRSKGGVDVSGVAVKFGGGGHRCAAGLRSKKPMAELIESVLNECRARLREWGGAGERKC